MQFTTIRSEEEATQDGFVIRLITTPEGTSILRVEEGQAFIPSKISLVVIENGELVWRPARMASNGAFLFATRDDAYAWVTG